MGDLIGHAVDGWSNALVHFRGRADHDTESPVDRRLSGAGNRRVGKGNAGRGKVPGDLACQLDG